MKLLTKRAYVLLLFSFMLIIGLFGFTIKYIKNAPVWVQYPSNPHLYTNGRLNASGTIYDKNGELLFQTINGGHKYNEDESVRTAVMHAIGDGNGNIVTSTQVAYNEKLSGWSLFNGTYRFNESDSGINSDISLTLDADICDTAYKALNGRKGTVGVYNYKTGEILCMVSSPSFDPENPPDIIANPEKYEGVYINRLLSATYTPGSVFKLVTAAAAIDNLDDINTKVYHCDGEFEVNGERITCQSAHGDVTFEQALAKSCNVAFAQISISLGGDTLQKYAEKTGMNSSLKVNSINTAIGKTAISGAEGGNLAWAGIGQYTDMVNPLNFMTYVGSIANDGIRVSPRILKSKKLLSWTSKDRVLSEETAIRLGGMMRNDVIEEYGDSNYEGLILCAKSGTAEVGGDKEPHAWFVGYLDREDCPLAFVVVVENGGAGSRVAGPVAAKVLNAAVKSIMEE